MKKKNVATLDELVAAAKSLGVRFYACEMAMQILDVRLEDLDEAVKGVVGVAGFLEQSQDGHVLFL
jgi:peroxiredoxin family protein